MLRIDPSRPDIRVQRANMLKDCGQFEEADAEYRLSLAQRPLDADTHLQLGHLQKLRGARSEAIEHYRRAAVLDPRGARADHELALAGERDVQELRFRAALATGAGEGLLSLVAEMNRMRDQLERALRSLPDLVSQAAFPPADYDTLRRLWSVPPPPSQEASAVSVIVRMDDLSHDELNRMTRALAGQSAPAFQVVLVGTEPSRRDLAERVAQADRRFEYIDAGGDPRELIRRVSHDLVVLPEPATVFHEHALAWFVWAAVKTGAAAFVCDAERIDVEGPGRRVSDPALRHAVDYEILLQDNPYGRTLAFDRTRCPARVELGGSLESASLALLLELAAAGSVGHIPYPLAAATRRGGGAHAMATADYAAIVRDHLRGRNLADRVDVSVRPRADQSGARVRWLSAANDQQIDLVIPTRDNGRDLSAFASSVRARAARAGRVRLTVIDNGTTDPESQRLLNQLAGQGVDVHQCDEPFNWSRLSNIGARRAGAGVVVFANDDMLMLTDGWDEILLGLLGRPEVGAVGAKLLYPDDTIQHAGILFGWRGRAIHDGLYEERHAPGPGRRWQMRRRVAAVTGAFLALRRPVFEELGGFDERRLAISYSDIDLSLRVRRRGLAVLYAPEIELTHYESKSRGLTHLSQPAAALDEQELAALRARWPGELDRDVTVHPMWHAATLPFRLLCAQNRATMTDWLLASAAPDPWRPGEPRDLGSGRESPQAGFSNRSSSEVSDERDR